MVEKRVTVLSRMGLHARPVSLIVAAALPFDAVIRIERPDGTAWADAKQIMDVMMLNVGFGETLLLKAEGKE
jgi:phosphocarrier protein